MRAFGTVRWSLRTGVAVGTTIDVIVRGSGGACPPLLRAQQTTPAPQ